MSCRLQQKDSNRSPRASCPVFVKLQAQARLLSVQPGGGRTCVAFPEKAEIYGKESRFEHPSYVQGPVCTSCVVPRRPRSAAHHCGHAGEQRFFNLLRTNEVDMRIDPAAVTISFAAITSYPDQ